MQSERLFIKVGARPSPLSRVQVGEVWEELRVFVPDVVLEPVWVETVGDKDRVTPLSSLGKTDFFTKEIDALLLEGGCRVGVHSAKDLPEDLRAGLVVVALTQGVDPSDVLVLREGERVEGLRAGAKIGTSSPRREEVVRGLREDLRCVDIRGNIGERLKLLDEGVVDGVVMAEAALIRLQLTGRNRLVLEGQGAIGQGQLAVMARVGDEEMRELFGLIDVRGK